MKIQYSALFLIIVITFVLVSCDDTDLQQPDEIVSTNNATTYEKAYKDYLHMLKDAEENAVNIIKEAAESIENFSDKITYENENMFYIGATNI